MTELEKAARQALEALLEINELSKGENAICLPAEIDGAMDALRRALEQQPAGEPVAKLVSAAGIALEVLEKHRQMKGEYPMGMLGVNAAEELKEAFRAQREFWTLEQQPAVSDERTKDEPVGEAYLCDKCHTPFDGEWECPSCGHRSATKEPVYTRPQPAAPAMFGGGLVAIKTLLSRDPCAHAKVAIEMIDAMLAQPAPQWVGLTDGEIISLMRQFPDHLTRDMARAIEAKLREKNGGKA